MSVKSLSYFRGYLEGSAFPPEGRTEPISGV